MPSRIDEAGHTKAFDYPVAEHWGESRNYDTNTRPMAIHITIRSTYIVHFILSRQMNSKATFISNHTTPVIIPFL